MNDPYDQIFVARQSLIHMVVLLLLLFAAGCASMDQFRYDTEHESLSLQAGDLAAGGIGFLTPAAATGREADKQALALSFAKKLQLMYPQIRVVALPHVLSAVNAADLDEQYKQMYRDYLETSILEGSILRSIGEVSEVRYFAQLSLASFKQSRKTRFGFLGLRVSQTESANIRTFVQIWDAHNASVAWEGFVEFNFSYETSAEAPVTFQDVAELAAEQLFSELPGADSTWITAR